MNPWLICISIAYLLGSIPFGYLLVRIFRKQDIRATGSGNIGATNVARSGAKGLGVATLLLDLAKAYMAVEVAKHLAPGQYDVAVMAAVAAVLGHMFPMWLRFRGGKGVASGLGVFLALTPLSAMCILGVFLLIVLLTRYVSLGSILASASLPFFAYFFVRPQSALTTAGFVAIAVLIIAKHKDNMRRLLAGTEHRFGAGKATA
jgi:glycerol-3-phosphate acyltransferase PlsY